ncbi:MAG: BrnA antitoxin family protein [Glycocaulis sp.]
MSPRKTDPDNPEWTKEDFAKARPAGELPPEIRKAFPRTRGPQKAPKKIPVSLRLSPEVVEHFKSGGPGWQARIDDALRKLAEQDA